MERRRAEAHLSAKTADLKLVTSAQRMTETLARIGHWRIHPETRLMTWSEGLSRVFGRPLPPGGVIPLQRHLTYYHPEDRPSVEARVDAALTGDGPGASAYQGRSRILWPDGSLRHVIVQGATERDATGRLVALHGLVLDVTEIAASEARLRERDLWLRATLENMDQGLVMLDAGGNVRLLNPRARQLLDLPASVLHENASLRGILAHQAERGDFAALTSEPRLRDASDRWLPVHFDWPRPDGTTLEARATTQIGRAHV